MSDVTFRIDGKQLSLPGDFFKSDSFTVKSVPWSYKVRWENAMPVQAIQALLDENPGNLLLVDENVHKLHLYGLKVSPDRVQIASASEDYKSLVKGALPLVDFLAKRGVTKSDKLIVVGGGITQDVGAFAAGIYKRGIPFVLFPSTLLSMCDSCIGGKTGVNHNGAKNQLAFFSAPREVVLCSRFLNTLPRREIRGGLGEILKLYVTGGKKMLDRYRELQPLKNPTAGPDLATLKELIFGALGVKKAVIEADEFELNLRKSLNYGHTIGHAIESLSDYAIPHGHAVTVGMLVVNELAFRRKLLGEADKKEIDDLSFELLDPDTRVQLKSLPVRDITDLLRKDKKTTGGDVNFVMIASLGDTIFFKIKNDEALAKETHDIIRELFARA